MKHFYSVIVFATTSRQYKEPSLILIDPGMNVFTVLTDDVNALVEMLRLDGHRVDEVFQLDDEHEREEYTRLGS